MPEKLTNLLDVRKSAYFDPLKDISWCHLLRYIKIKDIFGTSRSKHYIIFIKHDCTMHLNESIMRKWENTGQNRPFFGNLKYYVFLYFTATILYPLYSVLYGRSFLEYFSKLCGGVAICLEYAKCTSVRSAFNKGD